MREIKFRAWDRNAKKMIYENTGQVNNMSSWELLHYFDILLQYTGLKDKNGKEIYEGDILKGLYWGFNGEKEIVYDVWYRTTYPYLSIGAHYQIDEIIGSIYENPELLEAK